MELTLNRTDPVPQLSTTGRIWVAQVDFCFSMERSPDDPLRIPGGGTRYKISLHTPNAPRLVATLRAMVAAYESLAGVTQMPQLNHPLIAERDPILIHPGNIPVDSDGCVLAGMGRAANFSTILSAQLACSKLYPIIIAAVNSEGCWLTVNDPADPQPAMGVETSTDGA